MNDADIQKADILAHALGMVCGNYTVVPPADAMQHDIKALEARLKQFPSDDYAEVAREMIDDMKQALLTYHQINYTTST